MYVHAQHLNYMYAMDSRWLKSSLSVSICSDITFCDDRESVVDERLVVFGSHLHCLYGYTPLGTWSIPGSNIVHHFGRAVVGF